MISSLYNCSKSHSKKSYLQRLITKKGEANLNRVQIERKNRSYFSDLFNTIVDLNWLSILFWFALSFSSSWIIFGLVWHFLLPSECVVDNDSLLDALMFSIETQQTIGYGVRSLGSDCKLGLLILMMQCAFAVLLESIMGGIVLVKLSRPKKRTETLIFSRSAVLATRDGELCLMCRLGDIRRTHIICALAKMFLIQTRLTREGEIIPFNAQELELSFNSNTTSDRLLFMPIIIEHRINKSSPLHELISPSYLKSKTCQIDLTNNNYRASAGNVCIKPVVPFLYDDFEIVVRICSYSGKKIVPDFCKIIFFS
jgi:potassium inwardly-rectifying channel subfamily J